MRKQAYIFDVDGVLNNATDWMPNRLILDQIIRLLINGSYVAINTGRGHTWVKDYIINDVLMSIPTSTRSNVFIAAEMGGITVGYTDNVEREKRTSFGLTSTQINEVKKVYDARSLSKNLEWYEGKLSMATIYKPLGIDPALFIAEAQEIRSDLQKIFARKEIKISVNYDSLDVMAPKAGKWAGAELIYEWLQHSNGADIKHIVCFGDNASDYEMARFFDLKNHTVEFIFTGESPDQIEHSESVTFIKTRLPYSEGTITYLREHAIR